jgi:DNA-binding transcriptional LysR family regulator
MSGSITRVADVEWLPPLTGKAHIAIRTNGRARMATLAGAGIGMACLPRFVGDTTPQLRLLRAPTPAPERPLWLGVHRDMHRVPRVRETVAFLTNAIGRLRTALAPG